MHAVTVQLRLIALDADDLAVISTHVQDARVQTADIIWKQSEKRLVVGMNRLDWEQTLSGETASRRLIAALRFDRVLSCKSRNIELEAPGTALELLGIEFHPGDAPGGSAVLMFSHGAALRLDVECLECELTDLGADDLGTGDFGEGTESPGLDA
jgi:hypothetical protein